MKNITILTIVGLIAMTVCVSAQTYESYSGSKAVAAAGTAYIRAGSGQPIAKSFNVNVQTSATVTVYTPKRQTTAYSAVTGTTNAIALTADSSGYIEGVAPAALDYVIFPTYGASNAVYAAIGTVHLTNGYTTITLSGGVLGNAPAGGVVYFGEADDKMEIGVPAGATVGNEGAWAGHYRKPVWISVPAGAGVGTLSGVTEYR